MSRPFLDLNSEYVKSYFNKIESVVPNILKQDFFKYISPYDPIFNNIRIACIGNPPFGKIGSLAVKFINHSCYLGGNIIGMILPRSFKK